MFITPALIEAQSTRTAEALAGGAVFPRELPTRRGPRALVRPLSEMRRPRPSAGFNGVSPYLEILLVPPRYEVRWNILLYLRRSTRPASDAYKSLHAHYHEEEPDP